MSTFSLGFCATIEAARGAVKRSEAKKVFREFVTGFIKPISRQA